MPTNTDRILGALLGSAVGDALGMPIEGLSHQNVRTYYKGIKGYRADEKRRDLDAGQWTGHTQRAFAVAAALAEGLDERVPQRVAQRYVALHPEARRWDAQVVAAVERLAAGTGGADPTGDPTAGAAPVATPLGLWWAFSGAGLTEAWTAIRPVLALTHAHPASLVAGFGHAFAVRLAVASDPLDRTVFWACLLQTTRWAEAQLGDTVRPVSTRLERLTEHLDEWPLDLQDLCDGTGTWADEAWPFACAMVARHPDLVDATLLAAVNVGSAATAIGSLVGGLLGALHGWSAFPDEWRDGLEAHSDLEARALALAQALDA
ncbi:MAG: ADP-ribosylglycohydrolase family protein [Bacteroidota bacterium]